MSSRSLIVGTLLIALSASASAQWRENGKPVPDTMSQKTWGNFGAMLQLTDKPDELFATWGKPGAAVPVSAIKSAKRGEPVVGVIFFSGCSMDDHGLCDAEVTFRIFRPDGTPYSAEEHAELWIGKPPPRKGQLQLGVGAIGAIIEPQDPHGTYSVRAHLHDKVSQARVELVTTFEVARADP